MCMLTCESKGMEVLCAITLFAANRWMMSMCCWRTTPPPHKPLFNWLNCWQRTVYACRHRCMAKGWRKQLRSPVSLLAKRSKWIWWRPPPPNKAIHQVCRPMLTIWWLVHVANWWYVCCLLCWLARLPFNALSRSLSLEKETKCRRQVSAAGQMHRSLQGIEVLLSLQSSTKHRSSETASEKVDRRSQFHVHLACIWCIAWRCTAVIAWSWCRQRLSTRCAIGRHSMVETLIKTACVCLSFGAVFYFLFFFDLFAYNK